MAKNSTKPLHMRHAADGAPPINQVSRLLLFGDAPEEAEGLFSFNLEDVNEKLLDQLARHEAISFHSHAYLIAAKLAATNEVIGHVPHSFRDRVLRAIQHTYTAWISDVFDQGVEVSVQRK